MSRSQIIGGYPSWRAGASFKGASRHAATCFAAPRRHTSARHRARWIGLRRVATASLGTQREGATHAQYLDSPKISVEVMVTKSFELINPLDVCDTQVNMKPSVNFCRDFLGEASRAAPPFANIDRKGKKLDALAAAVLRETEKSANGLPQESAVGTDGEFGGTAAKDGRTQRLLVAQAKAKCSAKRRRVVQFSRGGAGSRISRAAGMHLGRVGMQTGVMHRCASSARGLRMPSPLLAGGPQRCAGGCFARWAPSYVPRGRP